MPDIKLCNTISESPICMILKHPEYFFPYTIANVHGHDHRH